MIISIILLLILAGILYEFAAPAEFRALNKSGALFAKFTPGAIVSEIRNKIAATVFTKNAAGAAIRNRVTPINRRSNSQTNRRQRLASLASSWRGLTESERAGWNAASANFPVQDNLGQTIYLTGEQLYVRCNANLLLIGQAQITAAPNPTSFEVLTPGVFTAEDDDTITLAFTPTPVPAGFNLVIRATPPVSAGKSFVSQSAFKYVQTIAAAGASPANIAAAYEALYGSLANAVGQKIFVEAFLIEIASGLAGQSVRTSAIVTAAA